MSQSIAFRNDIPFIKDLGIEFVSAENGRAVVALDLAPRHLNSWSVAHGGVLMTLLDVAMAVAGRSLDPAAGGGVTVEMKPVSCSRPMPAPDSSCRRRQSTGRARWPSVTAKCATPPSVSSPRRWGPSNTLNWTAPFETARSAPLASDNSAANPKPMPELIGQTTIADNLHWGVVHESRNSI